MGCSLLASFSTRCTTRRGTCRRSPQSSNGRLPEWPAIHKIALRPMASFLGSASPVVADPAVPLMPDGNPGGLRPGPERAFRAHSSSAGARRGSPGLPPRGRAASHSGRRTTARQLLAVLGNVIPEGLATGWGAPSQDIEKYVFSLSFFLQRRHHCPTRFRKAATCRLSKRRRRPCIAFRRPADRCWPPWASQA